MSLSNLCLTRSMFSEKPFDKTFSFLQDENILKDKIKANNNKMRGHGEKSPS